MPVRRQKIDDFGIDSTPQAAATKEPPPTLTDQKGRLVRYEIRMKSLGIRIPYAILRLPCKVSFAIIYCRVRLRS